MSGCVVEKFVKNLRSRTNDQFNGVATCNLIKQILKINLRRDVIGCSSTETNEALVLTETICTTLFEAHLSIRVQITKYNRYTRLSIDRREYINVQECENKTLARNIIFHQQEGAGRTCEKLTACGGEI